MLLSTFQYVMVVFRSDLVEITPIIKLLPQERKNAKSMLYLSAIGVLNTSFTSFKTAQYFRMLRMSKICTAGSNWFVVI